MPGTVTFQSLKHILSQCGCTIIKYISNGIKSTSSFMFFSFYAKFYYKPPTFITWKRSNTDIATVGHKRGLQQGVQQKPSCTRHLHHFHRTRKQFSSDLPWWPEPFPVRTFLLGAVNAAPRLSSFCAAPWREHIPPILWPTATQVTWWRKAYKKAETFRVLPECSSPPPSICSTLSMLEAFRAQKPCESRGGCPGLPSP